MQGSQNHPSVEMLMIIAFQASEVEAVSKIYEIGELKQLGMNNVRKNGDYLQVSIWTWRAKLQRIESVWRRDKLKDVKQE